MSWDDKTHQKQDCARNARPLFVPPFYCVGIRDHDMGTDSSYKGLRNGESVAKHAPLSPLGFPSDHYCNFPLPISRKALLLAQACHIVPRARHGNVER